MTDLREARHFQTMLRGYLEGVPDYAATGPTVSVDEKFQEVDRIINVLRQMSAFQTTILEHLIAHAEASV